MSQFYQNDTFLGAGNVKAGRFDIFRKGEDSDCRHIGTFTAGTPKKH